MIYLQIWSRRLKPYKKEKGITMPEIKESSLELIGETSLLKLNRYSEKSE